MTLYEKLEKLHPDIIRDFRKTGKSNNISESLQAYIIQLDRAIEIYNLEKNITRGAEKLGAEFTELGFRTCKDRIYDAINYFHLNNTVKEEAWCNLYADYFENLSRLAVAQNNITEARRCAQQAAQYRMKASQGNIDPDQLRPKDFLMLPDVKPERLGLPEFNMRTLWADTQKVIESIGEIDNRQKSKLKKEAAMTLGIIEDIDHEELS